MKKIYSNDDVERVGAEVIVSYLRRIGKGDEIPDYIDIDDFVANYLRCPVVYENIQKSSDCLGCHILRHTFCTKMMQLGVNIRILQEIMGHEEFSTTMDVYVNVTGQMELEEFSKFEELNRIDDVLTIVGPNDVWT